MVGERWSILRDARSDVKILRMSYVYYYCGIIIIIYCHCAAPSVVGSRIWNCPVSVIEILLLRSLLDTTTVGYRHPAIAVAVGPKPEEGARYSRI